MPPAPEDEHPHPPAGEAWRESWSFDFATADGHLGGSVRFVRLAGHAWYEAVLGGQHRQLLAVVDHEVPFRSSPFEIRTTGLWADHVCETPLDHWTLGLEAFAVGLDDPLELLGRQHGDQVALGLDLEWETDGPVADEPSASGGRGYVVPCRVHGEVLIGAATIDLDAAGHRRHRWGTGPGHVGWSLAATMEDGERWLVHHHDGISAVRTTDPGGRTVEGSGDAHLDGDGVVPSGGRVDEGDRALRIEVLTAAPVPVEVAGHPSVRVDALCRVRAGDGRTGVGWLEVSGRSAEVGA